MECCKNINRLLFSPASYTLIFTLTFDASACVLCSGRAMWMVQCSLLLKHNHMVALLAAVMPLSVSGKLFNALCLPLHLKNLSKSINDRPGIDGFISLCNVATCVTVAYLHTGLMHSEKSPEHRRALSLVHMWC